MVPIPHVYGIGYLYKRVNCSHREEQHGLLPALFKGAVHCVTDMRTKQNCCAPTETVRTVFSTRKDERATVAHPAHHNRVRE